MALGKFGDVHVLMARAVTNYQADIYYTWTMGGGSWTTPVNLSNDEYQNFPIDIRVDPSQAVHVLWTIQAIDHHDLFYSSQDPDMQTTDITLSQAVTIPLTMTNPTSSFFYQLGGASTADGNWFNYRLDDGLSNTSLLSTTTNTDGWTHSWFDLSAWVGKTVTMTFTAHQEAGAPNIYVTLDEVVLGSAYPDIWLSVEPLRLTALPGEQLSFVVKYGNRSNVPASDITLTDLLPTGFLFVDSSLPPVSLSPNLIWNLGDLPAQSEGVPFTITVQVTAEAVIKTYLANHFRIETLTPEVDINNNEVITLTFIGTNFYFPVLLK